MSAHTKKQGKLGAGRVKVDQEEDKMRMDREETKENSDAWGIRIPSGFDPDPTIVLRTSVKKDEPSDGRGGLKHKDKEPMNVKPEDTKQEHTKCETKPILSPARLWDRGADGQLYIPRPTPAVNKLEDDVDPPDYPAQNHWSQVDRGPSPPPSPQRQPSPPPERRPSLSPQRLQSPLPFPEPPQPPLQAQRNFRDGRIRPTVEVLLPRLKEVRRRQAASAASQQHEQRQLAGPMRLDQNHQNLSVIKPEPEDEMMPLVALEDHGPAEVREVLHTAVENLRNPDVKVKKELILSDEFVLDALTWEGINHKYPVPLPKEVAEFPLHRNYISHLYGGNTQEVGPQPAEDKLEWHGLSDWIFLTLDLNPHAPTRPGHSGLFFRSYRAENDKRDIRRTFIRVAPGKWVYMGQYKFEPGLSLTAYDWTQQRTGVRRAWTKAILTKTFGAENCVEIWLRKQRGADYKITQQQVNRELPRINHIRANLTEEDVIGAFDRGEQEIGTYRMTCVGYEAEFIQVLVRNVPKWIELEREKALEKQRRKALKAEARAPQAQNQRRNERRGTGSKRKTIEIESDSEDDGAVNVEAGSDDSYEGMPEDLPPPSTGRPRRAAATVKRQRTS